MKKDRGKNKDVPKAVAEGDKLPEEGKGKEEKDEMNEPKKVKGNKDAPKANAEGDKLPEEGKDHQKLTKKVEANLIKEECKKAALFFKK